MKYAKYENFPECFSPFCIEMMNSTCVYERPSYLLEKKLEKKNI